MSKQGTDIVPADQIKAIEAIAQECSLLSLAEAGRFEKAIRLASGIKRLKAALTGAVMAEIMPLMGSPLGFRTDKDTESRKYTIDQVRECLIEAVLRGANPVGNEFNIIAARAYMTKEFFERMVGEYPKLTDLRLKPGVPRNDSKGKGALVPFRVDWKLDGVPDFVDRTEDGFQIPVRVNANMIVDAIVGKATRKILAQVFKQITGSASSFPEGDVDSNEPIDVTPVSTDSVKERIRDAEAAHADAPGPDPDENPPKSETPPEEQEMLESDELPPDLPPHDEDGVVTEEDPDGFRMTDEMRAKVQPTKGKKTDYYKGLVELGVGVPDEMWFEVVSKELDHYGYPTIDIVPQSLKLTFLGSLAKKIKAAMGT